MTDNPRNTENMRLLGFVQQGSSSRAHVKQIGSIEPWPMFSQITTVRQASEMLQQGLSQVCLIPSKTQATVAWPVRVASAPIVEIAEPELETNLRGEIVSTPGHVTVAVEKARRLKSVKIKRSTVVALQSAPKR